MLVSGGLLDQPVGEWYAMQRAGYIYDLLDRHSKVTDWVNDASMSADDIKMIEELKKLKVAHG